MSSPVTDAQISTYRAALVPWYARHARELPWRSEPDPYRVWVSEIMLQQTRVEAVIPYFQRFLARFPDVAALAAASEEEVLEAWSGLGYYRRARMLHAGARIVEERFEGRFPINEADVLSLPGIGRYTAGAIRSIAFGERAPLVDGNVARVLSRAFGIRGVASAAAVARVLWDVARRVVGEGEPAVVNQAQMELGALVCTPADPACGECPLATSCVASRQGLVDELPEPPRRRRTVEITRSVLLVRCHDDVLLRRRRSEELSPGMWDLPGAFTGFGGDLSSGFEEAASILPFDVPYGIPLGRLKHAVTYRRVTLEVVGSTVASRRARRLVGTDGAELLWCPTEAALERALSSPARRVLGRWGRGAALDTPESRRVS